MIEFNTKGDALVDKLRASAGKNTIVHLEKEIHYITFDIISSVKQNH